MATCYEFGLRFRATSEEEGSGTTLATCEGIATHLTSLVRGAVLDVKKLHPTVLFDGMVMLGTRET